MNESNESYKLGRKIASKKAQAPDRGKNGMNKNDWTTLHGHDSNGNKYTQPVAPGMHNEATKWWKTQDLKVSKADTHEGRNCHEVNCKF